MVSLEKKSKRLDPIIEERKIRFDDENQKLLQIRHQKILATQTMRAKQAEYMDGVNRLNAERGSAERSLLEALEGGLDAVKRQWMSLYEVILKLEQDEAIQLNTMSCAHRDLEAIKHLQIKYQREISRTIQQREMKQIDDIALRKFNQN
ncbi:MAG: hypothetical protein NTV34_18415 [Proteobacteria bacterium]|nr:hypothetical protein [Pseudomonadota bacterium]